MSEDAQDLAGIVDSHFKEQGHNYGVAFISEKDRIGFPSHVLKDGIGQIEGFDEAYDLACELLGTDDVETTRKDNFIWFTKEHEAE
jgi:hypothetical protein